MSSFFEKCLDQLSEWIYFATKQLVHWYTGKCEIERTCLDLDDGRHTATMTTQFANCIRRSKKLKTIKKKLFEAKLFSVEASTLEIVQLKHIRNAKPLLLANMANCLHALRLVSAVKVHILTLRQETFSYDNSSHIEALELLWTQLQPGVARSNLQISSEWGLIGFQGKDPATDFRGMGLFGLAQLVYFTKYFPIEAKEILLLSQNDDHYFPFAVAGINITSLVCDLLESSHCHRFLFQYLDNIILQDTIGSHEGYSEDSQCVALAERYLHNLYCEIFLALGTLWKTRRPANVMEFPKLFQEIKMQFQAKYPPLHAMQ